MNNILTVEKVSVAFGRMQVINSLSFEVRIGEILGIIGPNGAGKTTLLNALIGLVKPHTGRITFNGKDITSISPAKRCHMGIGRTYQVPRPFENMTVFENVLVGSVHGARQHESQAREKTCEILNITGLIEKANLFAEKLGLLDRKRLELARALATNPKILLLDEVAAGLTEAEVMDVLKIVRKVKNLGVTIIWIEHIIMTMLEATDRLMCIAAGEKLLCGDPREVLESKVVEAIYLGVEEN